MKKVILSLLLLMPLAAISGEEVYPKGTVGYAQSYSKRICTNLIPDITHNYNVSNLELAAHDVFNTIFVNCTYRAKTQELNGDLPTVITALLNTTNNRFTVEFH